MQIVLSLWIVTAASQPRDDGLKATPHVGDAADRREAETP
jgi:hypothetical protein